METPSVYIHCIITHLVENKDFVCRLNLMVRIPALLVTTIRSSNNDFILTVTNINGKDEPAILCKVKFDTFDGDGAVQVFDIDENSEWNAIGLNQVTFFSFKGGWVVVIGKRVDHVTEVDNEEELRVKFKKDNRSMEPL